VLQVIKTRPEESSNQSDGSLQGQHLERSSSKPSIPARLLKPKTNVHQPASLIDILGFNPKEKKQPKWQAYDESKIQKKYMPFFKALMDFRQHVQDGMDLHAQETLKHSSKEDSGDLSGYGQHIADAGTDTFDRDFALGLLSSEQDLMYEIDEAIQRIFDGTYGICEITGKAINRERLLAVPFTRFSVEGQTEYEKTHRPHHQRITSGIFNELEMDHTRMSDVEDGF
jgi:DnaK suppressor protein